MHVSHRLEQGSPWGEQLRPGTKTSSLPSAKEYDFRAPQGGGVQSAGELWGGLTVHETARKELHNLSVEITTMLCAKTLTKMATRPGLRTMQSLPARRMASGPGGPTKPAESSTAPKMPGWQIAAIAGVAVAGFYSIFIAKPDAVAKSSILTNQTKNPSQAQTEQK
ncbi:hypothetical protein NLG97_g7183 [Lecanicillium saksenae]|uniref:Uncharacterized protein n=1 Tax=Lecanicillium saksenae TaxID=468837 RepID=A0ACC1QP43_9HYPO|nr:hypothetical protein NLG97_g7183 [Lecanicillium saksenae]